MKLTEIQKTYDHVISLGYWCDGASQLRNKNLRREAFPFDWMLTPSLGSISSLIRTDFKDYMTMENLIAIGQSNILVDMDVIDEKNITQVVYDKKYHIASVHDIPLASEEEWPYLYKEYILKVQRRVDRFTRVLSSNDTILFIRVSGNTGEVARLIQALDDKSKGPYTLLIINPTDEVETIFEENIPELKNVCFVNVPLKYNDTFLDILTIKRIDQTYWDSILNGITLS
ncbi:DUF1796 family putative cysteine peptidase [Terribacillus sp. DMT04]|uniref:DUF1796 family putative cysteine peptidase n=1 Tax=Terribacillus sp. DMT04 TaxID=2850441 RepID=UPI001C2C7347|nr:DUF1796 family putative cysteine peptidase [Terribacillus sp. DMT04]QXE03589.1 papain-like cysteine peptidase [Terribacillus sp. DMT04]